MYCWHYQSHYHYHFVTFCHLLAMFETSGELVRLITIKALGIVWRGQ